MNKSNKPVLNKEEISLLGAGFYRLSEKNMENIPGKAEGLIFAQQAAQKSMNGIPVKKWRKFYEQRYGTIVRASAAPCI